MDIQQSVVESGHKPCIELIKPKHAFFIISNTISCISMKNA